MREIKFRAFDKTYKRFYYFKLEQSGYGDTANPNEPIGMTSEWMQYTGLKDKNGTEIYEGDIVKEYDPRTPDEVTVYKVVWNTARLLFFRNFFDSKEIEVVGKYSTYEIIGNIYENPTLTETVDKSTEEGASSEVVATQKKDQTKV